MSDFFDTTYEGKVVELDDGIVNPGDDVNLNKKDPTLKKILIGAGWNINAFDADALDLDLSIFMIDKTGKTRVDEDFIFYNFTTAPDGGAKHLGDSRTGAGDGDDESILIDTHALSFEISKVLIVLSIYKGYEKKQNVGMIRDAYIRILNPDTKHEICRYNLNQVLKEREETAMIAGILERNGPKWHFLPHDEFIEGGLGAAARRYGLIINQE
ncbi:MAG: TerD family protein [Alphaproteobacteria bacterium]|nr:TerD family protein [Alphaproteobacteria bacterium]